MYICPYCHQSLVGEQHTWKPILSNPLANHLIFLSIQVSWWLTYLRAIFPAHYGKLSTCRFKFAYKSRFLSVFHPVKWTRKLQERSVLSNWVPGQQYQLQIYLTGKNWLSVLGDFARPESLLQENRILCTDEHGMPIKVTGKLGCQNKYEHPNFILNFILLQYKCQHK